MIVSKSQEKFNYQKLEVIVAGFHLQDLLERIGTESYVLFINQDFDVYAPENRSIIQLGWSTI